MTFQELIEAGFASGWAGWVQEGSDLVKRVACWECDGSGCRYCGSGRVKVRVTPDFRRRWANPKDPVRDTPIVPLSMEKGS